LLSISNFLELNASGAYKAKNSSENPKIYVPDWAFSKDSFVRIFGKPNSHKGRRLAVALTLGENPNQAKLKAKKIIENMSDE